jgi:hypothetical protein
MSNQGSSGIKKHTTLTIHQKLGIIRRQKVTKAEERNVAS